MKINMGQGWHHYLGIEDPNWSIEKVKELLRGLIESGEVKEWASDEAILYSILETKGLTNIRHNRHRNFFKNLPEVVHIKKALDEIREYAYSDTKTPPDLSKYTGIHYGEDIDDGEDEEILQANTQELADLLTKEDKDPLDYGDIPVPL